MGACSSCLRPKSEERTENTGPEHQPLLNVDAGGTAQYGAVIASGEAVAAAAERARARAREEQLDPEAERREREHMERIVRGLSGRLLDVSARPRTPRLSEQSDSTTTTTTKPLTNTSAQPDYSALFDATFAITMQSLESTTSSGSESTDNIVQRDDGPEPDRPATEDSSEARDVPGETENSEETFLEKQKAWLRQIIESDPADCRWDWTKLRGAQGSLVLSFDEFE